MNTELVLQLIGLVATAVGIWVNLNNKITRIDTELQQTKKEAAEDKAEKLSLQESLKDLTTSVHQITISVARIETYIELTSKKNENR